MTRQLLTQILIAAVLAGAGQADNDGDWTRIPTAIVGGGDPGVCGTRDMTNVSGTETEVYVILRPDSRCYHTWISDGGARDSAIIWLGLTSTVCLDPDASTAGAATAQVKWRRSVVGFFPVTSTLFYETLDGTTLTGAGASACATAPPGFYYAENSTAAPVGKTATVSIETAVYSEGR